ncbi:hypothetical protein ACT4T3_002663 [Acinetobacter baumannii]
MIKPDWNIFKAKFSENPQNSFEWLVYSLCCQEFKLLTGILRFKNQRGIETELIQYNEEYIGWQAKFYDTSLSSHKSDFIKMIDNTKLSHPNITRLIVFTNAEWGQSKGEEPKAKKTIDTHADKKNIKLEWRCASYFETPYVIAENKNLYRHFFSLQQSVYEKLELFHKHSNRLMSRISSHIEFNNQKITIDRTPIKDSLLKSSAQVVLLTGNGGVGKTAIVKQLYEENKDPDIVYYVHKASEFNVSKISDFLFEIELDEFINVNENISTKVIIVDSAENLLSIKNLDPFREYLETLLSAGWKIWFTTRDQYKHDFSFLLVDSYQVLYDDINVPRLSNLQLKEISSKYNIELPQDDKLKDLLRNPFYFKEYLKLYEENIQLDYTKFRDSLWPQIISKNNPRRSSLLIEMAKKRANTGSFFLNIEGELFEHKLLDDLIEDGILVHDQSHYYIAHDIYEEWALNQYIDIQYQSHIEEKVFFENIGESLPIRRAFRKWLSEKLVSESYDFIDFIKHCFNSKDISEIWSDELLTSILLSENSKFFFSSYKENILKNNNKIFNRICSFLKMSCKQLDHNIFNELLPISFSSHELSYLFTKPKGDGWVQFIDFIYINFSKVEKNQFKNIVPILQDWNKTNKTGKTNKQAGLIAKLIWEEQILDEKLNLNTNNELIFTIISSVAENKKEVSELIDLAIKNKLTKYRNPYDKLIDYILIKIEGWICVSHIPHKIRELAEEIWFITENSRANFLKTSSIRNNKIYGIAIDNYDYYPASAYQTPIYSLLKNDFSNTLQFVLKIVNKMVDEYIKHVGGYKTIFLKIDELEVKQYIDSNLWFLYRGQQNCPDILISIHMALEKYLLEICKDTNEEQTNKLLKAVLLQTHSASITAIVASVAMAYYDKCFEVIKILISQKEILIHDSNRLRNERLFQFKPFISKNDLQQIFYIEREESNKLSHRNYSFDYLIRHFSFFSSDSVSEEFLISRQNDIYHIIDSHYNELCKKESEDYEDKFWRIYLTRIDKRLLKPSIKEKEDQVYIELEPQIPDDLKKFQIEQLKDIDKRNKYLSLDLWTAYKIDSDIKCKKFENYEKNPLTALEEVTVIWELIKNDNLPDYLNLYKDLPALISVVLIRDYAELLNEDKFLLCEQIVIYYTKEVFSSGFYYGGRKGIIMSINILPKLLFLQKDKNSYIKAVIVLVLLKPFFIDVGTKSSSDDLIDNIHKYLTCNYEDILSIYKGYLYLERKRQEEFREIQYGQVDNIFQHFNYDDFFANFVKKYELEFEKIESNDINLIEIEKIEEYEISSLISAFRFSLWNNHSKLLMPYTKNIINNIFMSILNDDEEGGNNYYNKSRFFYDYVTYTLESKSTEDIHSLIQPVLSDTNVSKSLADLINQFVVMQDKLNKSDNFWTVWNALKDKIVYMYENYSYKFDIDKIISSYMFANTNWKPEAKSWPALDIDKKFFFDELTHQLGGSCRYLINLIYLVTGIGELYQEESIYWLANSIKNHEVKISKHRDFKELIVSLENLLKKFSLRNKERIKTTIRLKKAVIVLLNFLVTQESMTGYMLREEIV